MLLSRALSPSPSRRRGRGRGGETSSTQPVATAGRGEVGDATRAAPRPLMRCPGSRLSPAELKSPMFLRSALAWSNPEPAQ